MKQKYVPIEKQSKRKQKEFHSTQRKDWGGLNPVTRKVPDLKAYDRKKSKHRYRHEPCLDFSFLCGFGILKKLQPLPVRAFKKDVFDSAKDGHGGNF